MRPSGLRRRITETNGDPVCVLLAGEIAGRGFGRHALAPTLSPKKTWEGALGGFAAAIAVCLGFQKFMLSEALTPVQAVGIGVLIGLMGQLSDLAESMIKRGADVKDSGTILPGHGGMLDRVDALLFAAPVGVLLFQVTRQYFYIP